jgi:hypothetical protein
MVKIKVGFVWPGAVAWVPNGRTILVRDSRLAQDVRLIAHELRHIEDARELGIWFIPTYIYEWIKADFSYALHPMEVAARRAERNPKYVEWAKKVIAANEK